MRRCAALAAALSIATIALSLWQLGLFPAPLPPIAQLVRVATMMAATFLAFPIRPRRTGPPPDRRDRRDVLVALGGMMVAIVAVMLALPRPGREFLVIAGFVGSGSGTLAMAVAVLTRPRAAAPR